MSLLGYLNQQCNGKAELGAWKLKIALKIICSLMFNVFLHYILWNCASGLGLMGKTLNQWFVCNLNAILRQDSSC